MELTTLTDRALGLLPDGRAKLDPISLAILMALLSELCVKIVDECWSTLRPSTICKPGPLTRLKLWRLIREATCSPRVVRQTQGRGWDGARVYQELGDDAYAAVLALGASLSEGEIAVIRLKGIS